ncbi:hypothetical protein [Acidiphilium iwatense]|uniref:Uncharacterized protein n=1 Tax=Acidiphilium iwatense TaxID=768198 RepID=A0ABS9E2L4_9PROT|nr:hypothetical protein [Acidiphilium iwatense]MCF3947834.1 hypothetical protein [Acidiphilium iwatense]
MSVLENPPRLAWGRDASSRSSHCTSQDEAPVKDVWFPQNAAHFGSPTPRCAAPAASLTAASPAEPEGLSSIKGTANPEGQMIINHAHQHAEFDRYPALLHDLAHEFGREGIVATAARIIEAEQADFHWDGRIAEQNIGDFENFDGNEQTFERVAILGYFQGHYYTAICIVDDARRVRWMTDLHIFDGFETAERAFGAGE